MKFLVLTFTAFILSLSVMPCTDGLTVVCDPVHGTTHDHHGHSHQSEDSCPPFCVCSCCGIAMVLSEIELVDEVIRPVIPSVNFHYEMTYNGGVEVAVWQPPTFG